MHLAPIEALSRLPIAGFGASTGAAAALIAPPSIQASCEPTFRESAVRIWRAMRSLVKTATLLIVGGADLPVIPLNRQRCSACAAP